MSADPKSAEVRICEDCVHHQFKSQAKTGRNTCGLNKRQQFIWPKFNGDAHGYAPQRAGCFVAKPAAETAPMEKLATGTGSGLGASGVAAVLARETRKLATKRKGRK